MVCPLCKLTNPDTALRCDCGYDFATGHFKRNVPTRSSISENVLAGFVALAGIIFLLSFFLLQSLLQGLTPF